MNNLFCNGYPYTDFHELNLSWVVKKIVELNTKLTEFVSLNTIKYADPIQWDITSQYGTNTVVIDPVSGVAYLSVKPVPMGVSLSDEDYWTEIFDLGQIIGNINKNLTVHNDGYSTTSTFDLVTGDWVLWNGVLYEAMHDIDIGDAYVPDANIKQRSVEELIVSYVDGLKIMIDHVEDLVASEVTARADADDVLRALIEAEVEDREDADDALRVELSDLITSKVGIEAQTRAYEDARIELDLRNLITSKVGIEASARIAEDSRLNGLINDLSSVVDDKSSYKPNFANVKELGATGDGNVRPLSQFYSSLDEARVDFPFVNSLAVTIDAAAIQKAVNTGLCFIPKGHYIINTSITLPQGSNVVIQGESKRETVLYATLANMKMFNYNRTTGACILEVYDTTFNVIGVTGVVAFHFFGLIDDGIRYEDNWLTCRNCAFFNFERAFELYCCSNIYIDHCYAVQTNIFAHLSRAASFAHFSHILHLAGYSTIYCDDPAADGISNGVYCYDVIGVFNTFCTFRFHGYQLVELQDCSADFQGGTYGGFFLYQCQDCNINGCWCAGTDVASSFGIRIWDTINTNVNGSTIEHFTTGVRVDAGICCGVSITNNSFTANSAYDVAIYGGTGTIVTGNTFKSVPPTYPCIGFDSTNKNVMIGNVTYRGSYTSNLGADSVVGFNAIGALAP